MTGSGYPTVSGGGIGDGHPPKPKAKSRVVPRHGPKVRPRMGAAGGNRRKSAREAQRVANQSGDSFSPEERQALMAAVPKYGGIYVGIWRAIQDGDIEMEVKDRSQQAVRSRIQLQKLYMLKDEEVLPEGSDLINMDENNAGKGDQCGKESIEKGG